MAGREPITIKLGERDFVIRPLTLGQIERIEKAVVAQVEGRAQAIETGVAVVAAAFSRDFSGASVDDTEADVGELTVAMKAILALGGFTSGAPGEWQAAADASTGPVSEAA